MTGNVVQLTVGVGRFVVDVRGAKFKRDMQAKSFKKGKIDVWNMLPGMVVDANETVTFKKLLGRHVDIQGIKGYRLCARS